MYYPVLLSENKGQRFNTDKLFEFRIEERFRAYYVRLGYAHRLERHSPDHASPVSAPKLTFREYLPVKKVTGYENITELLQKVDDLVRRKGWSLRDLHEGQNTLCVSLIFPDLRFLRA